MTETGLCPVAGPVGDLFPRGLIYFINIFRETELLAAIHAAKTGRPSTELQFYRSATSFAFQIGIFHSVHLFYPICSFF
jgi:hypothetical protein